MNLMKPLEEAGKIQHLGIDFRISRTNRRGQGWAVQYLQKKPRERLYSRRLDRQFFETYSQTRENHHELNGYCILAGQNTIGDVPYRTHCCKQTHQRLLEQGDTSCKSGLGDQTRKPHVQKCICICILHMYIWRIPEERTYSGRENPSRGCLRQSPVQTADGPAHAIWSMEPAWH